MSDDKRKKKQDSKLISLKEPYEVETWTKTLGCTAVELRDIVSVGHSASAVRAELKRRSKKKG